MTDNCVFIRIGRVHFLHGGKYYCGQKNTENTFFLRMKEVLKYVTVVGVVTIHSGYDSIRFAILVSQFY